MPDGPRAQVVETCGAEGWSDGNEYRCDLLPGHDGKHVDGWEGWTW